MRSRKLNLEEAADMRRMYHDRRLDESIRTLAHLFRVSEVTVHKVLDRKGAYKNDPSPEEETNMGAPFKVGDVAWFTRATIFNDVGGTSILPTRKYSVCLSRVWHDYETGWQGQGVLTRDEDVTVSRAAGYTGHKPEDYQQGGLIMVEKVRQARVAFDPSCVFVSEFDLAGK